MQPKALVYNPGFQAQKDAILSGLDSAAIDPPLAGLIAGINKLACSFTLQCCFGHFVHKSNRHPFNTEALPEEADIRRVDYKIAYLAFCLDESPSGRELYRKLEDLTAIDPGYIQFGSAMWFLGKVRSIPMSCRLNPNALRDKTRQGWSIGKHCVWKRRAMNSLNG